MDRHLFCAKTFLAFFAFSLSLSNYAHAAANSVGSPLPEFKSEIKSLDTKNYAEARRRQGEGHRIGPSEVTPVAPFEGQAFAPFDSSAAEHSILIQPLRLQSLISVNRNLSPFGLDSSLQEKITLREVLLSASGANLKILRSASILNTRKWFYLNALADYLPTVNLGFNELGINSVSSIPIRATAIVPGSNTGPIQSLATKTAISTPITLLNSGFSWKPIQGGRLLASASFAKHQLNAAKATLRGDISDVLLSTANDYYDLVYNDALLQIRMAAVDTSTEQVRQNESLEASGLATNLDILQAKTQLAKDRQNLVEQQRVRRTAAIKLAHDLNVNLGQDLLPAETTLRKVRLISPEIPIAKLLTTAIEYRPELKRYEQLRLAAKKQIAIARSDLLPSVSLGGNIIGIDSKIGHMYPSYLLNFAVSWKFDGLGTKAITNMEAQRWQARQAMLEANEEFLTVLEQVRNSYNQTLTTDRAIDESTNQVLSAEEELRLAKMRMDNGLGTNLDVLTAQRDLTQARLDKALALINFNKAQAQLLHDTGVISIDALTRSTK
jgi:outer membrane protein TolC